MNVMEELRYILMDVNGELRYILMNVKESSGISF